MFVVNVELMIEAEKKPRRSNMQTKGYNEEEKRKKDPFDS